MLCENCGKRPADYHYKININGNVTEKHLCAECASALGGGQFMPGAMAASHMQTPDFADLLNSFLLGGNYSDVRKETEHCRLCGASLEDIANSGKMGCPECYNFFAAQIEPGIRRIHGPVVHTGKVPGHAGEAVKKKRRVDQLKSDMDAAVAAQEYEKAAKIRDELRALEQEGLA